jgi:hypothetical protein
MNTHKNLVNGLSLGFSKTLASIQSQKVSATNPISTMDKTAIKPSRSDESCER